MKQQNLRKFFILTFLGSWLFWLPGILLTYQIIESTTITTTIDQIGKILGGITPSVFAFYIIYKSEGKAGIKSMLKKLTKFKLGKWYFAVFLIIPLTIVLAQFINTLFGFEFPIKPILSEPWMILPLFMLFVIMIASEEFGWRGYVLDQLQLKWSAFTSSIALGLIWGIWHLPMFFAEGFGHHDIPIPFVQFMVTLVFISILITWVQNNTGSLIPAFIMHALVNLSSEILPLFNMKRDLVVNHNPWIIANALLFIVICLIVYKYGTKTFTLEQSA